MLNVLIVSVAYNPPTTILKNLEADYYPHLVIDNSEQEMVWLKEYCLLHNHIYQWMGGNVGIAKALNVGASYAMQHGFDYIVTMDQDSKLTKQMLIAVEEKILNFADYSEVAVFSPKHQILPDDVDICKGNDDIISDDIFLSMTSGNFVNLAIWKKLNGFDENLFIDGVDIDYYIRAHLSGYKVITFLNLFISHELGGEFNHKKILRYGFDVWNHSAVRKYYIVRNYLYIYKKYRCKILGVSLFRKVAIKLPISVLFFEKNKISKLFKCVQGYIDYRRGKLGKYEK